MWRAGWRVWEAEAEVGHEVQAAAGPAALRLAHHHHPQGWQLSNEVQAFSQLHSQVSNSVIVHDGGGEQAAVMC